MKSYDISLKFDHPVNYPQLYWTEDIEPIEVDILEEVKVYAIKNKIPLDFIEENAVLFIEGYERVNGEDIWDEPDFIQIDFEKLI